MDRQDKPCFSSRAKEILNLARKQNWLGGFDFAIFMQEVLISDGGYVIDTGNWENVNAEVALRLAERIKRHPVIWKLLFMIA